MIEIGGDSGDWEKDRRTVSRTELIGIIRPRVEEILETVDAQDRAEGQYFVGLFLERRGKEADAKRYLEAAARSEAALHSSTVLVCSALAAQRLRAKGAEPFGK